MSKHKNIEIIRTDLLEHPAVKAWHKLLPGRVKPESIELLHKKEKSTVYRLVGVGLAGTAVIAKRCRQADAIIEKTIYEEILPHLPLTAIHYYGFVAEPEGKFGWLFLEDAGSQKYSPYLEAHRVLAAQWLGLMHTSAARVATDRLPDRGPDHYLKHLQAGRYEIQRNLANPTLQADDRLVLEHIVSQCGLVELRWSQVKEFCAGSPQTLIHGDFTRKNLRVRAEQTGLALLPFDWEEAGWGVPATDLAQSALWGSGGFSANPDVTAYWLIVRDHWPSLDFQMLQRLASCGKVFRCLAAINWTAQSLAYEAAEWVVGKMRIYQAELLNAIQATTWAQ